MNIVIGVLMVAAYMIAGLIVLEMTIERARKTGILLRLSEWSGGAQGILLGWKLLKSQL